jgi:hypothetical protein
MIPPDTKWDIEIMGSVAVVIGRMDFYDKDVIMFMLDYIKNYYKELGLSSVVVVGSLQQEKDKVLPKILVGSNP